MAYSTDPYLEALLQRRTGYAGVPTVSGVTPYNEGGALTSQNIPLNPGVSRYGGGGGLTSQDMATGPAGFTLEKGLPSGLPQGYSVEDGLPSGLPQNIKDLYNRYVAPSDSDDAPNADIDLGIKKDWATMGMSAGNNVKDMSGYADINNNLARLRAMGVPFDPYQRERQPIELKGALNNYMGGLLF